MKRLFLAGITIGSVVLYFMNTVNTKNTSFELNKSREFEIGVYQISDENTPSNQKIEKMVGDYISSDGSVLKVLDSSSSGHMKIFYKGAKEKGLSVDGNSAFVKIEHNYLMFQMGNKDRFYELIYAEDEQKITLKIFNLDEFITSKEFSLSY